DVLNPHADEGPLQVQGTIERSALAIHGEAAIIHAGGRRRSGFAHTTRVNREYGVSGVDQWLNVTFYHSVGCLACFINQNSSGRTAGISGKKQDRRNIDLRLWVVD